MDVQATKMIEWAKALGEAMKDNREEEKESLMSDKKKEERLTEFQMNMDIIRRNDDLRHSSKGQDLVEKAIGNLDKLIAPVV